VNATRNALYRSWVTRRLGPVLMSGLAMACRPVASEVPAESPPAAPAAKEQQQQASPPRTSQAASEVIVKFRDASEAGRLIAPVVAGNARIDSVTKLTSDLSKDAGSPLQVVRVTSGRELVLAIDQERVKQTRGDSIDIASVSREVVEQLRKRGDVEYAQTNILLTPRGQR
jgi:hypothetical protein